MFKNVLYSSQNFTSKTNIFFHFKTAADPFVGFIINKRFGNAVSRNKFKNRARHLYATLYNTHSYALIVKPQSEQINYLELKQAFIELENRLSEARC